MPNMVNHPRMGLASCYGAVVVAVSTTAEALLTNNPDMAFMLVQQR